VKQANDPNTDYKALVRQGYDLCAAAYEKARWAETNPELTLLTSRLSDGATVLDVGCGAGVPIARALAERFIVTGVDISCEMISRAHVNVPEGRFILRDIMSVEFPPSCFDAAVAFYSIFHLPREEHPCLFQRIHGWLKPGGYLLATVSQFSEAPYTEDDFHGVTMYWSNLGLEDYKKTLSEIGFALLETTVIGHGYREASGTPEECHPLIFARKG